MKKPIWSDEKKGAEDAERFYNIGKAWIIPADKGFFMGMPIWYFHGWNKRMRALLSTKQEE